MQVQSIISSKIQYNNSLQIKRKDIPTEGTNTTTLPAYVDAKSFVNINFKAAIHDYAKNGDWEGIQRELDKGVDVNIKDDDGWTALIWAADNGKAESVEKLLQHPDIDVNIKSNAGNTALILAADNGNAESVEKLLQHSDIDVNIKNNDGHTALILAAYWHKTDFVEKLLQRPDIDVNIKNNDGDTALKLAAYKGNVECVEKLLQHPDTDVNIKNNDGYTALMVAVWEVKAECVEKLLQHPNVDVNIKNDYGNTALILAARDGKAESVEKLLQHPDIDVSIRDNYGNTALDYANKKGYTQIAEMIKNYKRGVDRRTGVIKLEPKKLDIEKLTSYKEIWTKEEKQNIQKLTDENNYSELAKLFESKGVELNRDYEQFKKQMSTLKEETKKSVRESETEKIREEEKVAAKKEYEKAKADYDEKNAALDEAIGLYHQNLAEDIEYEKNGIRALYGIEVDELPNTLDFGGQMINVINVLTKRKNKLNTLNSGVAERITKALQDNKGKISVDGLKFLERIIDASEERCDEGSLTDSIQSVKRDGGFIDASKAGLFVSILSMGGISLRNVIKEIGKYAVK